ncbi:ATP-dependent Lon protease pim1, partial [Coemansia sp. RSA 1591]
MVARRWFQASAVSQKKKDDDNNGSGKKKPTKSNEEKKDEKKDETKEAKSEGSHGRRTIRRSEGEQAAGVKSGQPESDPLSQLKRAVGVTDYGDGQQSFIPDNYPNVMMLPITRRPLFPSLYKSIQVQDPQVIGALKELVERGEPYVATFMLKDDDKDVDTIKSMDEVHEVGVFSRIMSIYVSPNPEDKHLTVALYPWRRVRMKRILDGKAAKTDKALAEPDAKESSSVSADAVATNDSAASSDSGAAEKVLESISSEYEFTALEVENVKDEPYDAKDRTISATMSEIVSVLREITQMNPMFREQIQHFASAQVSKAVFENPSKLADFAAALSGGSPEELQSILSDLNV